MNWNELDYIVHGILQARILEWVAFPFSRGSSQPRDQTQVSHIAGRSFTSWATREAHILSESSSENRLDIYPESRQNYSLKRDMYPYVHSCTIHNSQEDMKVKVTSLRHVWLSATPWTVLASLLHPWDFPGKITRVGCHFLLQVIFPTQGSNPGLLHCKQTLYHLSHKGASQDMDTT